MRHRFDQSEIDMKSLFDQFFAVTCDGTAADGDFRTEEFIDLGQLFAYDSDRVAFVGAVIGVDDVTAVGDDRQLGSGGAAVDTDIGVAPVRAGVFGPDAVLRVAAYKILIFVFITEQRRQGGYRVAVFHAVFEMHCQRLIVEGCAVG